ncbi:MAG: hypothetical protein N2Z72_02770 [Bacteroidales bacterium]|nr:hypothetical protein [Bacteroidales bacterium]
MILIADAGATKTAWRIFDNKHIFLDQISSGIHPLFMNVRSIESEIEKNILPFVNTEKIERVYFYCAGCATPALQTKVYDAVSLFFPNAYVYVGSDLEGAARGILGNKEGLICIIGTGSNAGVWNGDRIISQIPSLGYILGDEGSASWIGRQIVSHYFRKTMPHYLRTIFEQYFSGDLDFVYKNVYQNPSANLFLSSVTEKFIQIKDEFIEKILSQSARIFFETFVLPIEPILPLGFAGSIAKINESNIYYWAKHYNLDIISIQASPIEGLYEYYLNNYPMQHYE